MVFLWFSVGGMVGCNNTDPKVLAGKDSGMESVADTAVGSEASDTAVESEATDTAETGELNDFYIAPLRVHVFSGEMEMLDAASIYTEAQIEAFIAESNVIFEPTGIQWTIADFRIQETIDEDIVAQSVETGSPKAGVAMSDNVDLDQMLSPSGWDLFVLRQTSPFGNGGFYRCSLDGQGGPGAAFTPLHNSGGGPQAVRKWAHELGHMLNLPHTPCTGEYAENLMMSGACEYANPDRIAFTADQIEAVRQQYETGLPAECGN